MDIIVHSEDSIKQFITNIPHIVISIRSNNCLKVELPKLDSRIGVLYLEFPDFDDRPNNYPYPLFSQHQAEQIIRFVERRINKIGLIICQCEAGISRSAGVAGALSMIYNGEDEYFFRHYLPNRRVYRLILESYFGKGM